MQHLHPEHVEVEICRAEELAHRRGLSSKLDERWAYVVRRISSVEERGEQLLGMRKLPMCTQLIPVRKDLQISKERGECSMLGQGGRERNYLVPHRQHKAYRVKAQQPELQFPRSLTRPWRKDSRKAMLTGYPQSDVVKVIPPSQRTTHIGG